MAGHSNYDSLGDVPREPDSDGEERTLPTIADKHTDVPGTGIDLHMFLYPRTDTVNDSNHAYFSDLDVHGVSGGRDWVDHPGISISSDWLRQFQSELHARERRSEALSYLINESSEPDTTDLQQALHIAQTKAAQWWEDIVSAPSMLRLMPFLTLYNEVPSGDQPYIVRTSLVYNVPNCSDRSESQRSYTLATIEYRLRN